MTPYGTIGGILWVLFAFAVLVCYGVFVLVVKWLRLVERVREEKRQGDVHFGDDGEVKSHPTDKTD